MNDYVLKQAENQEERIFLSRIDDLVQKAEQGTAVSSSFLDMRQQYLARLLLELQGTLIYYYDGGFPGAERQRIIIHPDWMERIESNISCVKFHHKGDNFIKPGHRDYLGAILALGVKREKVGDIVVQGANAYVFLDNDIVQFILSNLLRVKKNPVEGRVINSSDLVLENGGHKIYKTTLASIRLDAVVSSAFKLSRSQAVQLISSEKVRVNHKLLKKNSAVLQEGDLVSVRGVGRVKIETIGSISKKGRYHIEFSIF